MDGYTGPSAKGPKKSPYGIALAAILALSLLLTAGFIVLQGSPQRTDSGPMILETPVPYGIKFTLSGNLAGVATWGSLIVLLSDGTNAMSWANITTQDLTSSENSAVWHYGSPRSLGPLSVWLNITDRSGDGRLDNGDSLTFTTGSAFQFSSNASYVFDLLYRPTGAVVFNVVFTG